MDIQGIGLGGAIVALFGLIKTIFNSNERKKLQEIKMERKFKEAADKYVAAAALEYDQKIKNILQEVVKQTEEIQLLRHSIERLAEYFKMVVDISKEHINDETALEIISKIEDNASDLFTNSKIK